MGSTLTHLLKEENDKSSRGSTLKLTVYLPNCSSMDITVNDTISVQDVIVYILSCHKELGQRPPLKYDHPNSYELRIHDGGAVESTHIP